MLAQIVFCLHRPKLFYGISTLINSPKTFFRQCYFDMFALGHYIAVHQTKHRFDSLGQLSFQPFVQIIEFIRLLAFNPLAFH